MGSSQVLRLRGMRSLSCGAHALLIAVGAVAAAASGALAIRRMSAAWLRCSAASLALVSAHVAAGQAPARSVNEAVSVPEGAACLTRVELAAHIESWLGRASVDEVLSILVELPDQDERTGVTFLVVRAQEVVARRSFPSLPERCADRRAVLALAIAIAIDATVLERFGLGDAGSRPASEPRPALARPTAAAPSEVQHEEPEEPPQVRPWHMAVGADVGVVVGALPVLAFWGGGFLEVRSHESWLVRAGAGATPVVAVPLGRGSAESQLLLGRVDGCLLRLMGIFEAEACLGAVAGRIAAEGRGYAAPSGTDLAWAAAAARMAGRVPREGVVALRVALDGFAALLRPTLEVRGRGGEVLDQRRMPAAGLGLSAALVVILR